VGGALFEPHAIEPQMKLTHSRVARTADRRLLGRSRVMGCYPLANAECLRAKYGSRALRPNIDSNPCTTFFARVFKVHSQSVNKQRKW
jgi:hypothetical protein